jgi:hypothetical protein
MGVRTGLVALVLLASACTSGSPEAVSSPTTEPTPLVSLLVPSSRPASPTPSPTPEATPDGAQAEVERIDDGHLLVSRGRTLWVRTRDGRSRRVALPEPDTGTGAVLVQAFADRGAWWVMTSDCADAGLKLFRSFDDGRSWTRASRIGFSGCHAGDRATLHLSGRRVVLVTTTGVGEHAQVTVSPNGLTWSAAPRRLDSASTLAFRDDGSYVRVAGFGDFPDQVLSHAHRLGDAEQPARLPGKRNPLGYSLARIGARFVVLAEDGTPYRSRDGSSWHALTHPFPGCRCERLGLDVLSARVWWAETQDRGKHRYAVTRDGGTSWSAVPGPPGPDPTYPNHLIGWNAEGAVVDRGGRPWVTTDSGRHWNTF